ncbi:MAG: methionine--tRNA ligase subunit beta, partial [Bacteroidales bacterium]|nr:methionine--tRNA ligase subunit beta [Bacteroidales bacterium]
DVLRYVLTANAPETKDNNFTWADFQARNNNELLAILGNFVHRTLILTQKYFDGKVPAVEELNDYDKSVLEEIKDFPMKVGSSLDHFRFREALSEMMNLARLGNKYLTDSEPWKIFKTDEVRVRTILNISLQICANLSILSEPFLPFSARKLSGMLNLLGLTWKDAGSTELLKEGHQLNKSSYLFEKIEDSVIEAQIQKLLDTKKANEEREISVNPVKDNIEYDDFMKLDIRTGTIIEAEKVPKTNKLLKLKIDSGIDQRTVISGIAEFYEPEKIIGQKVSILVNLASKKLRGIESNGMILMAENNEGKLCFVAPIEEFNDGSEIK